MEIQTERLLLRDFTPADWPAVLAYQSDPRYLRYYEWTARTPEAVQAFVQMFVDQAAAQPRYRFQLAIVDRLSGALVGNAGIRLPEPGARVAELGYELDPAFWGRGYATEAARALLAFGFGELRLHRAGAWCIAENAASTRVLARLGFRLEGRLRDQEYFKGRWWDVLLYGLLDDDPAVSPWS